MPGLLATLVATNGWRPEPVATEALVHLLSQLPAAKAFGAWVDGIVPGLGAPELQYLGHASTTTTGGRPDIVGCGSGGVRLIVEAKFAAALTPKQAHGGYATHLVTGAPGLLVYLVPTDRVVAMWSAAVKIHDPISDENLPGGARRLVLAGGHAVTVLSWADMLDRLAGALAGTDFEGDLAQLSDLVAWRTGKAWLPLLPDDLPDRVGRQVGALARMVGRAANAASATRATDG
jgi:hypothetical protein